MRAVRARRASLTALTALGMLLGASRAQAYCRTTTTAEASSCPAVCDTEGTPLYWASPWVTYAFNERGFPGLSDAQLRATFAASFQPWEEVRCDGTEIGFHALPLRGTTSLEEGPRKRIPGSDVPPEPNLNVIAHYEPEAWARLGHSDRAFAVTAVWFVASDAGLGRITGADMGFNGGMGAYGDCVVDPCPNAVVRTDLQNVATHEIGHMLGLAHSDVGGSTMSCDALPEDTNKRSLEDDDVAGLCAAYPPARGFAASAPVTGGCSVSAVAQATAGCVPSWLGALLAVVGLHRSSRKRRVRG